MPRAGHRDLKPENMLIEPDGGCAITDFGLAAGAARRSLRRRHLAQRDPPIRRPEQLLGERVDQRSDLYSLGAVAYFALLGRPRSTGHTGGILARQTTDDLPPLHASRGDVPREFEEVLRRAMTGDPAARYASAQQFRQAVRKPRVPAPAGRVPAGRLTVFDNAGLAVQDPRERQSSVSRGPQQETTHAL